MTTNCRLSRAVRCTSERACGSRGLLGAEKGSSARNWPGAAEGRGPTAWLALTSRRGAGRLKTSR